MQRDRIVQGLPGNHSFGVFTSSESSNFLSKEDVRKHFFQTTSDRDFYERKLTAEDTSENMIHVHNAGKTYGKYLPYKPNTAPMLDRTACGYTREYTKKPNLTEQFNQNQTLSRAFRPARAKAQGTVSIGKWESGYCRDFTQSTPSEMANAKPSPLIPAKGGSLEAVLGGRGEMMVKKSHQQTTHHGDFKDTIKVNGEAQVPSDGNIKLQGYHSGDFSRTSYYNDFCGKNQRRSQAVGSAFRNQIQKSSSSPSVR